MDSSVFIDLLKQELGIEESVSLETVLKETEWWDSMSVLDVIALADREFQLPLILEEFREVHTINDIYVYITGKMQG